MGRNWPEYWDSLIETGRLDKLGPKGWQYYLDYYVEQGPGYDDVMDLDFDPDSFEEEY